MSSPGASVDAETPARPPRIRSVLPKLVVSLLIAGGFVWVLKRGGLPILPPAASLAQLDWWGVPTYVLLCSVATFFRTYRWLYLLTPLAPQISGKRVFGVGLVGFTAIFFAPLRMGEIVRPWLLAQDRQVTFLQAAGTVAAERIIDGLTLTLLLVGCLVASTPLSPLPDHVGRLPLPVAAVPAAAYATCAVFAAALVVMVLFYRWRALARRISTAVVGVVSPRAAEWTTTRVEKLADGFRFLPSSRSGVFLRDTIVYWALMLIATWQLLRRSGLDAQPAQAGVVLGVMGLGTLIPSGPGFFGTYQLAAYCGLAMFFAGEQVLRGGAVFAFVSYSTHVLLTSLFCVLGVVLMTKSQPPHPAVDGE